MTNVFISCQDIDAAHAQSLISALEQCHVTVQHSPRNPLHGEDPRWQNWYDRLLPELIAKANAFVIVLDHAWDSSTWMATESEEALSRIDLPMFVFNPLDVKVTSATMLSYLKARLPGDAREAAAHIKKALKR